MCNQRFFSYICVDTLNQVIMSTLRKLLLSVLLLSAILPLQAQKGLPAVFTGSYDALSHAPVWHGKDLYVNPYPGGQTREYVILRDSDGRGGIWDNVLMDWSISPVECRFMTFATPDMLCVRSKEGRLGVYCDEALSEILDGGVIPPLLFEQGRFQYSVNTGLIKNILVGVDNRWGVIGADGSFLVPTRYESVDAAVQAIDERGKYLKPSGMADYDFLMKTIDKLDLDGDWLRSDWTYQDPVTGLLFFTLKELPWSGPYFFVPETDPFYVAQALSEGITLSPILCVSDGLVTVAEANCAYGDAVFAEQIRPISWMGEGFLCLPLNDCVIKCAKEGERIALGKKMVFYGFRSPMDSYHLGYIFKGGSEFLDGIFILRTNGDEVAGERYGWYKDLGPNPYLGMGFFHEEYVRNGGDYGTAEEQIEWFNSRSTGFRMEEFFYIAFYDKEQKALVLTFDDTGLPAMYLPMTAAQAKQVEREGGIYDRGDWVLLATPYLDEDREIRYKDIYMKTPEGREFGKFVPR